MLDKLVQRAFKLRNTAQLAHWTATGEGSYARHQALGEFYEELIDSLDRYVEAHQGAMGLSIEKPTEDVNEAVRREMTGGHDRLIRLALAHVGQLP